jgi:hypothetical protein
VAVRPDDGFIVRITGATFVVAGAVFNYSKALHRNDLGHLQPLHNNSAMFGSLRAEIRSVAAL